MSFIAKPPRLVTGAVHKGVRFTGANNRENNRRNHNLQALEDNLRGEVAQHLARCRYRRWIETRPANRPVATGNRHGKLQAWRADDGRSRIFESDGGAS